jgi:transposase
VLAYDVQLEALRLLVDRRAELSRARIQCVNRVHRLLSELVPGQSKRDITTGQAKTILAMVKPRDVAGKNRRRLAAEQIGELVSIEKKVKALIKELKELVLATGSTLMELPGVGPVVAARTLADTGDVARFADRSKNASWTGTAPIEASSGEVVRHRLSRAGNRRMNHMIHIAAATQIRLDTPGRAYYRRKLAAGKSPREAMRCLKRRISDALYRRLRADVGSAVVEPVAAGPGGQSGATLKSSAAGFHPHTGTSDQPLPGPAPTTPPAPTPTRKTTTTKALEPAP